MKNFLALTAVLALTGCIMPTKQPASSEIRQAPSERILAFQNASESTGELVITRDIGLIGGACSLGVLIDGTLAAKIDTGERASFHLTPGMHLIAPTWIDGRGLCGAFYSEKSATARRRTAEVNIVTGGKKNYRIHTNTDGESTLEPVM